MMLHDCTPSPDSREVESLIGDLGIGVDRHDGDLGRADVARDGDPPNITAWLGRVTQLPGRVPQPPLGH